MPLFEVLRESTPGRFQWVGSTIQRTPEQAIRWMLHHRPDIEAATLIAQEPKEPDE